MPLRLEFRIANVGRLFISTMYHVFRIKPWTLAIRGKYRRNPLHEKNGEILTNNIIIYYFRPKFEQMRMLKDYKIERYINDNY